jgi:hypothetical protein
MISSGILVNEAHFIKEISILDNFF